MNQNNPQWDTYPPQTPRDSYTPPPPPKRHRPGRALLWVVGICIVGIVAVLVVTSLIFDGAINAADTAPHVAPPKSIPGPKVPAKSKPVEQAPRNNLPRDGVLLVPTDLKPGTYRATAPVDNIVCYWARLRDTDGDVGSIIANHVASAGDVITLTVKPTDHAVEVQCTDAVWHRVS